MNESGIQSLLLETSGTTFEACRSLEQDLTFITLKEEMDKRQIAFGSAQMETLKMIGSDKLFTNLAMLLSDQCRIPVRWLYFRVGILQSFAIGKNFLDLF